MTDRRAFLTAAGLSAVAAGTGLAASGCSAPARSSSAPTVTVPVADVPVGGGAILTDAPYVVTQPTAGSFKAFSKVCPHQGCPVTEIEGSEIVCKCHNSRFDIADGHAITGPTTSGLPEAAASMQGDRVIITPS